jgi:hypothetical protein
MAYPKHITASTLLDQGKSCLKSEKTKDKTGQTENKQRQRTKTNAGKLGTPFITN